LLKSIATLYATILILILIQQKLTYLLTWCSSGVKTWHLVIFARNLSTKFAETVIKVRGVVNLTPKSGVHVAHEPPVNGVI